MKRNIFIFCKLPRSKLYIKADIEKCLSPEACVDIECLIYFHLSYQDQKALVLPWYQKLPHEKKELFEQLQKSFYFKICKKKKVMLTENMRTSIHMKFPLYFEK